MSNDVQLSTRGIGVPEARRPQVPPQKLNTEYPVCLTAQYTIIKRANVSCSSSIQTRKAYLSTFATATHPIADTSIESYDMQDQATT